MVVGKALGIVPIDWINRRVDCPLNRDISSLAIEAQ
jgi:hypothetical protein